MTGRLRAIGRSREYGALVDTAWPLLLGFVAYSLAAVSTFSIPQLTHAGLDQVGVAILTFVAGAFTIVLGYESIILFGGAYSLGIAGFIARVTKSKQLIDSREKESVRLWRALVYKSHLIYLPFLLFLTSASIGWDIYTGLSAKIIRSTGRSGLVLFSLDIFATPQRLNVAIYSLRLTPTLILFTVISGLVPSIALPYFRRFRITGINAGPFHSSLLTTVVGSVVGVSVLITLLGIFYKVLWAGGAPTSYHYALLVLAGLSLHYAAGTYIGRGRAESIVLRNLAEGRYDSKRIVVLDETLNPKAKDIQFQSIVQDRWL
jgi:hypothetical protein